MPSQEELRPGPHHWRQEIDGTDESSEVSWSIYRLFFCTKPKNSVPDFQKLRCQKSQKTQFLPENSVPNLSKTGYFWTFSPKIARKRILSADFHLKTSKFLENSVPKWQKLSFPEIGETQIARSAYKKKPVLTQGIFSITQGQFLSLLNDFCP